MRMTIIATFGPFSPVNEEAPSTLGVITTTLTLFSKRFLRCSSSNDCRSESSKYAISCQKWMTTTATARPYWIHDKRIKTVFLTFFCSSSKNACKRIIDNFADADANYDLDLTKLGPVNCSLIFCAQLTPCRYLRSTILGQHLLVNICYPLRVRRTKSRGLKGPHLDF